MNKKYRVYNKGLYDEGRDGLACSHIAGAKTLGMCSSMVILEGLGPNNGSTVLTRASSTRSDPAPGMKSLRHRATTPDKDSTVVGGISVHSSF